MRSTFFRHGLPELRHEQDSGIHWGTRTHMTRAAMPPSPCPQSRLQAENHNLKVLLGALCLYLLLVISTPVFAQLDFELPGGELASERGFLRLSTLPPQVTLVNFWRYDCPPCLRELPLLNRYAAEHPEVRIITIALQKPSETSMSPAKPQKPVISLHGPSQPQGLLARFGNRIGALPFTVLLTPGRESCAQIIGEITGVWLNSRQRTCQPDHPAGPD